MSRRRLILLCLWQGLSIFSALRNGIRISSLWSPIYRINHHEICQCHMVPRNKFPSPTIQEELKEDVYLSRHIKTIDSCRSTFSSALYAYVSDDDEDISSTGVKKELNSETIVTLGLLFLVACLCSLDRVAMSVAVIPMSAELGYNEQVKGAISTIFSIGYLCGMLPAGVIGAFTSPKNVLAAGVLFWSLAQMISPAAAEVSLPALLASRFFMGVSESVTVPTIQNFVSRLVPSANKSIALGIILSGLQVGNIFAFQLSPYFLNSFGWDGLLVVFGGVGFLWLAMWWPLVRDNSISDSTSSSRSSEGACLDSLSESSSISDSRIPVNASLVLSSDENSGSIRESNSAVVNNSYDDSGLKDKSNSNSSNNPVDLTDSSTVLLTSSTTTATTTTTVSAIVTASDTSPQSTAPPSPPPAPPLTMVSSVLAGLKDVPFKTMLASKEVQSIAVAHAVQNFGLYINLAWLPTFFNQKYHLSVDDSSLSSVLPWVAGAAMGPLAGLIADKWIADGVDKTLVRKIFQSFALIVPALTLLGLSVAPDDLTSENAIAYFVLAIASAAVCVAGFSSSVQDVCASSKYVSIVYSITSLPAVLMGSLGVYATGVVLDRTHSFTLVFQGMAVVYLLGALFYALNYEAKKVVE